MRLNNLYSNFGFVAGVDMIFAIAVDWTTALDIFVPQLKIPLLSLKFSSMHACCAFDDRLSTLQILQLVQNIIIPLRVYLLLKS